MRNAWSHRAQGFLHRNDFLSLVLVFVWPFVFLLPYTVAFGGWFLSLGNDFAPLYYNYKVYLLDHLSHFSFPLWSPSEAAGFPFYSNPFASVFYPLNLLLAVYYRLAGGVTYLDYQRFAVLGISIFSLGLFAWLRQFNLSLRAVLFATLVVAVSYKLTEILRFPNAIHAAAWYPWILFALTKIWRSSSWKGALQAGVLLVVYVTLLITAGYPYYVYYAFFLLGPYLVFLALLDRYDSRLTGQPFGWKRPLVTLFLSGVAAVLICGPYYYRISLLMQQTTDRGGGSFEYSTTEAFNLTDTLGSLVFPLSAQFEGWYFFGFLGLLLILLCLAHGGRPVSLLRKDQAAAGAARQPGFRAGFFIALYWLIWFILISYITYGRESYLFTWLWKYAPLFASLRVWGRMNIILVPVIAWFLALAFQDFEARYLSLRPAAQDQKKSLWVDTLVLTTAYTVVLSLQIYFLANELFDGYWIVYFALKYAPALSIPAEALSANIGISFILFGFAAYLILLALIWLPFEKRLVWSTEQANRFGRFILVSFVAFSALNLLTIGPWVWSHGIRFADSPKVLNIKALSKQALTTPRTDREWTISLNATFNAGVIPNWYFERYNGFRARTRNEPEAVNKLLGIIDGKRLFLSHSIAYSTVTAFLDDVDEFTGNFQVTSYTGDEIVVTTDTNLAGYLSFIDNWDPDWIASIDHRPVNIELLFGTFKSVPLPAGAHEVIFSYRPTLLARR